GIKEEIKKVEMVLRNRGMLKPNDTPDFKLKLQVDSSIQAHKSILMLEIPYFETMAGSGLKDFKQDEIEITKIPKEVCEKAIEFLYSSDEDRKSLIAKIDDKTTLLHMAQLADFWQFKELQTQCDEELCNSIGELNIEKNTLEELLVPSQAFPKFA